MNSGVRLCIADDGSITTDFSFRDNGRGPDLKAKISLAPDGTLQRFVSTGKSAYGSPVDGRFERKGDRAEWSGKVDHATLKVSGKASYDRGSIERGKRADLILIDGDFPKDISAVRNVSLVLQDGDAYYPAELYDELGVKPFAPALKPD